MSSSANLNLAKYYNLTCSSSKLESLKLSIVLLLPMYNSRQKMT